MVQAPLTQASTWPGRLQAITSAPLTQASMAAVGQLHAMASQEGTHQVAPVGEDLRGLDHAAAPEHVAVLVQWVGHQHVGDGAHQELLADAEVCRAGQGSTHELGGWQASGRSGLAGRQRTAHSTQVQGARQAGCGCATDMHTARKCKVQDSKLSLDAVGTPGLQQWACHKIITHQHQRRQSIEQDRQAVARLAPRSALVSEWPP